MAHPVTSQNDGSLPGSVAVILDDGRAAPPPVGSLPVIELEPDDDPNARLPEVAGAGGVGGHRTARRRDWLSRRGLASCFGSALFHATVLTGLALIVLSGPSGDGPISLSAVVDADRRVVMADPVVAMQRQVVEMAGETSTTLPEQAAVEVPRIAPPTNRSNGRTPQAARTRSDVGTGAVASADLMAVVRADLVGALAGRDPDRRARLAATQGGSEESESAVERGLRWLMAQQLDDGSFRFDRLQPGNRNRGTETSRTAATGLALLPFLGAGYTHRRGPYQQVVGDGLYYLTREAVSTEHGVDLQQGTMYAQGIATIALCEALAMTEDERLEPVAREAVRFIVYAQDLRGGGWRYTPGEPGDTTVTGWQLMALCSGRMAGIEVPSTTLAAAMGFLDSVQSEYGARYGYMDPRPRETTSAIGLLCRMYLGWTPDFQPLDHGTQLISLAGPSKDNMYLNYYATQLLHHYDGAQWKAWNPAMRDYLVDTQERNGAEAGSWHFSGGRGDVGGRLYNTAMAVMTLEVYYRHMPLYGQEAVDGAF